MKNKLLTLIISILLSALLIMLPVSKVNAEPGSVQIQSIEVFIDNTEDRPNSQLNNIAKPGNKIIIDILFNGEITGGFSDAQLRIKFGTDGEERVITNEYVEDTSSGNSIQFIYTVREEDKGMLTILSDNILVKGETFTLPTLSETITVDNEAPQVVQCVLVDTEPGEYGETDKITMRVTFDENIYIRNVPTLYIKFGDGTRKAVTGKEVWIEDYVEAIDYEYNIMNGDNGELQILEISGGRISDGVGNERILNTVFEEFSTSVIAKTEVQNPNEDDNNPDDDPNIDDENPTDDPNIDDPSQEDPNDDPTGGNVNNNNSNDDTTSDKELPMTGNAPFIIGTIVIMAIIGIISYIKYKKYKEI